MAALPASLAYQCCRWSFGHTHGGEQAIVIVIAAAVVVVVVVVVAIDAGRYRSGHVEASLESAVATALETATAAMQRGQ
jgi:hypothetical protein